MKQYVLDEPVPAVPPPAEAEAMPLRHPGRWRWWLLALLLEPVALAILYVGLSGGSSWSQAAASHSSASRPVAYTAAFSFPREPVSAPAAAEPSPAEPRANAITQERGRYVIDLQDAAPGLALAMLTQATKARVAGVDIFIGSPVRLTRSAVATSPREAWQAVFGDVANFVIACAGSACEVRFVSLVKPGSPVPAPESLQGEFSHTEAATAPALAPPAQAPVDQAAAAAPSTTGVDSSAAEN